jgi:hypothetical protein
MKIMPGSQPARRDLGRRRGELCALFGGATKVDLLRQPWGQRDRHGSRCRADAWCGTSICRRSAQGSSTGTDSGAPRSGIDSIGQAHHPCAKAIWSPRWSEAMLAIGWRSARSRDVDSAKVSKCVVVDPAFTWETIGLQPWHKTLIYESTSRDSRGTRRCGRFAAFAGSPAPRSLSISSSWGSPRSN